MTFNLKRAAFAMLCTIAFLLIAPAAALAQDGGEVAGGLHYFGAAVGGGIIVVGAGIGIGRLTAAACESIARQPEVKDDIRGAMILAAALIEGAAFFALVVCIVMGAPWPG